jgi:hypothetical protein
VESLNDKEKVARKGSTGERTESRSVVKHWHVKQAQESVLRADQ